MSILLNAASLALVLFQQGGGQATPTTPPASAAGAQPVQQARPTVLVPVQGVEAPAQPTGKSSANYRRTTRVTPASRAGADYTSRVASPVRSLMAVRGMEENHVVGFGLVTGLAGTGDSGALATQLLANTLLAQNINIDPSQLSSSNIAVVRVEGVIPPGAKPGRKINIRVSTIGDAESLVGGVLGMTELTDITGTTVYATASGPITTNSLTAGGQAANVIKNHPTVGTLTSGGIVQRDIVATVVSDHGYIYLDAKNGQGTFGNTVRVAAAINGLYPRTATVLPDGRTVRVAVLDGIPEGEVIAYLDSALSLEVETDNLARVVVNERTGVIVMGGDVRLRPGVVQHGSIIVTIAESKEVSQPGPASAGQTTAVDRTEVNVVEGDAPLILLGGATSLEEVVDVLNVLGATPRDMISILEGLVDGGLLIADLRRL